MLKKHNNQMTESAIREMSHEELIQAVIRLLNVRHVEADDWRGAVYLPDELADAFRNRLRMSNATGEARP
jgi:hypothetical protein